MSNNCATRFRFPNRCYLNYYVFWKYFINFTKKKNTLKILQTNFRYCASIALCIIIFSGSIYSHLSAVFSENILTVTLGSGRHLNASIMSVPTLYCNCLGNKCLRGCLLLTSGSSRDKELVEKLSIWGGRSWRASGVAPAAIVPTSGRDHKLGQVSFVPLRVEECKK